MKVENDISSILPNFSHWVPLLRCSLTPGDQPNSFIGGILNPVGAWKLKFSVAYFLSLLTLSPEASILPVFVPTVRLWFVQLTACCNALCIQFIHLKFVYDLFNLFPPTFAWNWSRDGIFKVPDLHQYIFAGWHNQLPNRLNTLRVFIATLLNSNPNAARCCQVSEALLATDTGVEP